MTDKRLAAIKPKSSTISLAVRVATINDLSIPLTGKLDRRFTKRLKARSLVSKGQQE